MFGFNNNLTIGYPDIIYYITRYVAKDTTFEDIDPYLTMTEIINVVYKQGNNVSTYKDNNKPRGKLVPMKPKTMIIIIYQKKKILLLLD